MIQFTVIALTALLAPTSLTLFTINAVVSGLLILNELRQLCYEGRAYLREPFNYLDIAGNCYIILSAYNLYTCFEQNDSADAGEKFY